MRFRPLLLVLLTLGPALAAAARPPIFLSTDCEANGKIPAVNAMLSFATVAFDENKNIVGEFSANLIEVSGTHPDPGVMAWWRSTPENQAAYDATRVDMTTAEDAMPRYLAWIKSLPGDPIFVSYPASFDFMFVYWHLIRFAGEAPFKHRALDVRSFAMGMLGTSFYETSKETFPPEWFDPLPHTHLALDDAREQGALFVNMLRARKACELKLVVPSS